ncbi:sensor histidine kinase [Candidatus Leptofilum sp.]|uniref:sensor histidine kinase n=1 Tax=Candidatus Leptofilum sp. TaxID=3241576 RepID=UPI003B5A9C96
MTWFIADEPSGTIISSSMAGISIVLFFITKKKRIQLVSRVLVVAGYTAIMASLLMNGGIRDEAVLVLIALLSLAGFLLGTRAVIPLGVLTAVLLIILFIAEKAERIPEEEHFVSVGVDELVMALIAVFVTTVILHQITKQIIRNNEEIKAQALYLSEKNAQLEVTKQELIVAKEEAEEANRSRSALFSRMSHDLRTPLSSILGLTTHLMYHDAQLSSAERQEFFQGIHNSGTHLLDLINDLLDISRLEAQQLQLHINPVPLSALVTNVISMLRLSAVEKGLDLQLHLGDGLPEIAYVDEQRLRQVLINLLGNGIKFTQEGKVTLTVTAWEVDTAVPTLCFEVTDSGCGIAENDLQRIFDPFVQVANDPLQAMGTGLGLAISRQLVEAMGGTLQVESQLGQGSRFWFSLQLPETLPT